jgi:hypothetical protein
MSKFIDDAEGDWGKCDICGKEGHCFTLMRSDGPIFLCAEHYFWYLPDYHRQALVAVVDSMYLLQELREPFARKAVEEEEVVSD